MSLPPAWGSVCGWVCLFICAHVWSQDHDCCHPHIPNMLSCPYHKHVVIPLSQTSSSPYHEGCHPNVTISAIYIFSTASKMWQILASTQHKLHHLHILKVVVQMSRTLSSSYHEHRHLHITKRVIRISPTPSFTYFVLYQQSQNLWLYMSRTLPFICHEPYHPNVTNSVV